MGQTLSEVFRNSNVLLFKAKFRSPESYENYFGPFTGAPDGQPTGHWQVQEATHYTRLVINAQDRVWLFYKCQEDAECHSSSEESGLRKHSPQNWAASLKPQAGLPFDIQIAETETGSLSVDVRGQRLLIAKTPPPVETEPVPQSIKFIGPFAKAECLGAHSTIRQVWLWEDGPRSYAIGIFSTLLAGRQNLFVPPVVMGEGVKENNGWRFTWRREGNSGTALIALNGEDAILTFDQDGRDLEDADQVVLNSGAVFFDERIELAPLTSGADWKHWFDTVLVGHFITGFVPAC